MPIDTPLNNKITENDEIDLVQLWQILASRKYVVLSCVLVCVAAGFAFAFFKPAIFNYTTAIDIGSISGQKVMSTEQALALLEQTFIPLSRETMTQKFGEYSPEVKATIPKGSQLLVLTTKGNAAQVEHIKMSHVFTFESLQKETQLVVDNSRKLTQFEIDNANLRLKELEDPRISMIAEKSLIIEVNQAKAKMAELEGQNKYFESKEKEIKIIEELLLQQIAETEKNMAEAFKVRQEAITGVDDHAIAMTMLMINNQIQNENSRLAELKERLTVNLEDNRNLLIQQKENLQRDKKINALEIDRLESELVKFKIDLEMDQNKQKNIIRAAENKLNDTRDTRALNIATRSMKQVGHRKSVILLLSAFVGLISGVMLAFFMEFIHSDRRRSEA